MNTLVLNQQRPFCSIRRFSVKTILCVNSQNVLWGVCAITWISIKIRQVGKGELTKQSQTPPRILVTFKLIQRNFKSVSQGATKRSPLHSGWRSWEENLCPVTSEPRGWRTPRREVMGIYPTSTTPTLILALRPAAPSLHPVAQLNSCRPLPLEHSKAPNHICLGVAETLLYWVELSQCRNFSENFTRHLRAKLQKHRNKYRVFLG